MSGRDEMRRRGDWTREPGWTVLVGNIGKVYTGDYDTAVQQFLLYRTASVEGGGRAAGEEVTLMDPLGEIHREHLPAEHLEVDATFATTVRTTWKLHLPVGASWEVRRGVLAVTHPDGTQEHLEPDDTDYGLESQPIEVVAHEEHEDD